MAEKNGDNIRVIEKAWLGGGCFWCLDAVFRRVNGVVNVISGYAGGHTDNPEYNDVCTGTTGHAEIVQIEFDSSIISYSQILNVFWKAHDPTTLNRQGADVGTQYRSIIFTADELQEKEARISMKEAQAMFDKPIVTEVETLNRFYPAEEYHQQYYDRNKHAGYCRAVITPKLKKIYHENIEF